MEYFPGTGDAWQTVAPRDAGFDAGRLADAIGFANAHECNWPHSMYLDSGEYVGTAYVQEKPPYNTVIGEVRPRGGVNGSDPARGPHRRRMGRHAPHRHDLLVRQELHRAGRGACVRSRADFARRSRRRQRAGRRLRVTAQPGDHLAAPAAADQRWQGVLWDKPDSVDHNRQVGLGNDNSRKGTVRALERPGTRFEYNDVRVNRLALSLLRLLRRPLPEVLREGIMDPIGASDTWTWRGYRNSTVEINGKPIESVSGGGHWGGGLIISSRDHARVGQLMLRRGTWNGRQLVSERWLRELAAPSAANPGYGFLWWLNTGRKLAPCAPESSIFALGGGQNAIWIDAEHDLVLVVRWLQREHFDGVIGAVLASLK
jgi:hypothetical protein